MTRKSPAAEFPFRSCESVLLLEHRALTKRIEVTALVSNIEAQILSYISSYSNSYIEAQILSYISSLF